MIRSCSYSTSSKPKIAFPPENALTRLFYKLHNEITYRFEKKTAWLRVLQFMASNGVKIPYRWSTCSFFDCHELHDLIKLALVTTPINSSFLLELLRYAFAKTKWHLTVETLGPMALKLDKGAIEVILAEMLEELYSVDTFQDPEFKALEDFVYYLEKQGAWSRNTAFSKTVCRFFWPEPFQRYVDLFPLDSEAYFELIDLAASLDLSLKGVKWRIARLSRMTFRPPKNLIDYALEKLSGLIVSVVDLLRKVHCPWDSSTSKQLLEKYNFRLFPELWAYFKENKCPIDENDAAKYTSSLRLTATNRKMISDMFSGWINHGSDSD